MVCVCMSWGVKGRVIASQSSMNFLTVLNVECVSRPRSGMFEGNCVRVLLLTA